LCSALCWGELARVALAVPLLVLIPGTLVAAHIPFLSRDERAACAGSFGLAVVASSAFAAHLSPADPWKVNAAIWTAVVVAAIASNRARRRRYWSSLSWPLLGLWALFYLALVGLQGMTPIYAGGNWYGDWWEHFSIAQAYVRTAGGHESVWFGDYNLASRTPLFNLVTAFALSLFGDRFWVYQIASTVASSLFLLAVVLVMRELRGERAALLTAAFIFFNTWLVHDAMFTWAKMTAAYLLLLSLYFYLRFRSGEGVRALYMTSACGALAFMSHQSAAYYLAGLLADYGRLRPRPAVSWRQAATAAAILAAIVAPWHWWVSHLYGVVGAVQANPVLSTGRPTLARVLRGGTENAVTSLVPVPFVDFLRGGTFTSDKVLFRLVQLYFNSLVGAMTLSLVAALLWTWRRRPSPPLVRGFHYLKAPWLLVAFGGVILATVAVERPRYAYRWDGPGPFVWAFGAALVALGLWTWRRRPVGPPPEYSPHMTAVLFALAGYWGALLAHPGGEVDGIASNAMMPSVLLVVGYAVARVAGLPRPALALLAAGVLAEFTVTWALLANLMSGGPPFASDINHRLKIDNGLTFLYDAAGGAWRPFAALALLAQGVAVLAIVRASADQDRGAAQRRG
jgi:dolichyl-phosphate-mannose-protein mannosyltransferase